MASKVVQITSAVQLDGLLKSSKVVIADFFATWCGPCHMIAPVFDTIANQLSRANAVTFVKIDTDAQRAIAARYQISAMPTFLLFRDGKVIERVQGADPKKLQALVATLAAEAETAGAATGASAAGGAAGGTSSSSSSNNNNSSSSSDGPMWAGASLPRGYSDITNTVELPRLELLNVDEAAAGGVRVLFAGGKPSGRADTAGGGGAADWVESDTDEQLMLFIPLQSNAKLHTLQITSHPTEEAARPQLIKLYSNSPHNLGFDEAEDTQATQEIEIKPTDWNDQATAAIPLKFVKFQNITSLVVFVVSAEDGAEKVRLDRVRLVGEAGEKRDMGKLEKIGDEP